MQDYLHSGRSYVPAISSALTLGATFIVQVISSRLSWLPPPYKFCGHHKRVFPSQLWQVWLAIAGHGNAQGFETGNEQVNVPLTTTCTSPFSHLFLSHRQSLLMQLFSTNKVSDLATVITPWCSTKVEMSSPIQLVCLQKRYANRTFRNI
ncbi:hypothetical protein K431DRAFT_133977 [Polychaeton citri CBS 116435]|uniref:Uncharacterized protein n=1 Tax=Polychaeton citri CBS 116435 TaxID=1314669 RepID=A0A9P4QEA6_9PEZI|nr:hypothetical protein K431DRAFT_133977 [Polychaeton citri CBS 116435]